MKNFASLNDMLAELCPAKRCVVIVEGDSGVTARIQSLRPSSLRAIDVARLTNSLKDVVKVIREQPFRGLQFVRDGSVDVVYCEAPIMSADDLMACWHKLALGGTLLVHSSSQEALDQFSMSRGRRWDMVVRNPVAIFGVTRFHGDEVEVLEDCDVAIISGDGSISSWVYQTRRLDYDRNMLDYVAPFIKPDAVALDIGAFIGSHTVEYLKRASFVVAFEPNPTAFSCLRYNCPNAFTHNVALGDRARNRYWTRIYPNCGGSYLSDEPSPGCATVAVKTLDSLMLLERIGYAKIDAEGCEVEVLRGGRETFLKHKPVLCIEVNQPALKRTGTSDAELYTLLTQYGYEWKEIPGTAYGTQLDILATPKL